MPAMESLRCLGKHFSTSKSMHVNGVDQSCRRVIETDLYWVPSGSFVFLSESSVSFLSSCMSVLP